MHQRIALHQAQAIDLEDFTVSSLSFVSEHGGPYVLAPAYDMLVLVQTFVGRLGAEERLHQFQTMP